MCFRTSNGGIGFDRGVRLKSGSAPAPGRSSTRLASNSLQTQVIKLKRRSLRRPASGRGSPPERARRVLPGIHEQLTTKRVNENWLKQIEETDYFSGHGVEVLDLNRAVREIGSAPDSGALRGASGRMRSPLLTLAGCRTGRPPERARRACSPNFHEQLTTTRVNETWLKQIEETDNIFPNVEWRYWA